MSAKLPSGETGIIIEWPGRPEDVPACAGRMVRMLEGLGRCVPSLDRWTESGLTRRESSVPFSTLPPQLGPMIRRLEIERDYDGEGRPLRTTGVFFSAQCRAFGLSARLSGSIGFAASKQKILPNRLDIWLSDLAETSNGASAADWMISILSALIEAWQPATGRIMLPGMTMLDEVGSIRAGWILYLAAPLAHDFTPPSAISSEMTPDGGLLMRISEDPFDVKNPTHLAAFIAMQAALAPLDLSAQASESAR